MIQVLGAYPPPNWHVVEGRAELSGNGLGFRAPTFYAPSGCARPPSSPGRTAESPVLLGFRVQVGSQLLYGGLTRGSRAWG